MITQLAIYIVFGIILVTGLVLVLILASFFGIWLRAKIADAQYRNGLLTFDSWTIIQNGLVSSRKGYLAAQANLLINEAAWIQAKGGTLEDEKK